MDPNPGNIPVQTIPVSRLDPDPVTGFALAPTPPALERSIRGLGVLTPLLAAPAEGGRRRVIAGHRRLEIARRLPAAAVPVRLLAVEPEAAVKLQWQLQDNSTHRTYSDMEIGRALIRLAAAGMPETRLISHVLPLLGQEPAKKRLDDFLGAWDFSPRLQQVVHEVRLPVRVYSLFFRWGEPDREAAGALLETLRPGVNKCRDLLEMVEETAQRDGVTPAALFDRPEIRTRLEDASQPPGERFQAIQKIIFEWRYPHLFHLRAEARGIISRLRLDPGIRLRVPENF
ncbi:MAG: ParB/RepB/Spo0J family partition protein, partial [Nitrospinaceae bacterium]